jgi:uncharacterized protein (TIGR02001 family)
MKKILVPTLIAAAIGAMASAAQAQTAPAAPESTLSYNVGVTTDYRYRGISQTRFQPTLQGGADYADKSGFYIGAWASGIQWIKDTGTTVGVGGVKGGLELDLYAGYKGAVGDAAYDVGFLRYEYSGNNLAKVSGFANANTNEVYGAVTYGVVTAKYSHAISNLFGNPNSKNSYYLDLSANFDLGNGFTLVPHYGYQKVKNVVNASYSDYALTLNKDLGNGLSASAALVGTNANKPFYTLVNKYNGKSGAVLGLKYAF